MASAKNLGLVKMDNGHCYYLWGFFCHFFEFLELVFGFGFSLSLSFYMMGVKNQAG